MASPGELRRSSSEISLLVQRVAPRLEPHQLRGMISLTSGTQYELGLDTSVDDRGGRAGFAAVIYWPGLGHLLVYAQAWSDGPLSAGYSEGLALRLLLSWLQEPCVASDREPVRLQILTDRLDLVEGLDRGAGAAGAGRRRRVTPAVARLHGQAEADGLVDGRR